MSPAFLKHDSAEAIRIQDRARELFRGSSDIRAGLDAVFDGTQTLTELSLTIAYELQMSRVVARREALRSEPEHCDEYEEHA